VTFVLGLSALYHDSAACLVHDGRIVAAAQEERFSRVKGDPAFPHRAIAACLAEAGIDEAALDVVAFYEKPLLHLDRILEGWLATAPRGWRAYLTAAPVWAKHRLRLESTIRAALPGFTGSLLWCPHHESHAASAFFASPFTDAAVLTVDGVGEWATATIGEGRGNRLHLLQEMRYPDSLGLLYSACTYHAGFRVNSGEYKLMGLAPYGRPTYVDAIHRHLIDLRADGSFRLKPDCFGFLDGLRMTNARFDSAFGGPPRAPEAPITQREMDLAASVQQVTEEIVLRMARTATERTGHRRLCLAGGVALNAVANGRLARSGIVDALWVQPAAGDAGGALGAALLAWHRWCDGPRVTDGVTDAMQGARLGPAYDATAIARALDEVGARYEALGVAGTIDRTAAWLAEGKVVGFFDGRMEFGPRALGGRSILADPRDPAMQAHLNARIKFREEFRPFAPAVLAERAAECFEVVGPSPYMLQVAPVVATRRRAGTLPDSAGLARLAEARSDLPAITHVDHSARVQTVAPDDPSGFRAVLEAFERRTGCPVLINTSFNVRGEPIVASPSDAYACLMRTEIDALAIPPFFIERAAQPTATDDRWHRPLLPD
jgi:carbamoyltransferase